MGDLVTRSNEQQASGDRMLAMIHTRFPGYHPIIAIAELAHGKAASEDPRLALDCHKTLLKHISPELKSVEAKVDVKDHRRVVVSMFEGEGVEEVPFIASRPQVTALETDPMWDQLEQLLLLEAA